MSAGEYDEVAGTGEIRLSPDVTAGATQFVDVVDGHDRDVRCPDGLSARRDVWASEDRSKPRTGWSIPSPAGRIAALELHDGVGDPGAARRRGLRAAVREQRLR